MNKKVLALILLNATLLAGGIILILVSCVQFNNWWPFLTIFVNAFAILFPTFCGGCSMSDDAEWDDREGGVSPATISWVFLGFFIVIGYAIPVELFRTHLLTESGVMFTVSGGTIILAAILIFVRLIYFEKDDSSAYLF